ncbi:MAG: NAD(P)-dependent oxidoreductase [Leptospirales bacterium]
MITKDVGHSKRTEEVTEPAAIGWIGFGSMGSRMVKRLLDRGVPVVGYNRTATLIPKHPLLKEAPTPGEVARKTDILCVMVTDGAASRAILSGPDGVCRAIRPGSLLVNMSTIGPEEAEEEAMLLRDLGAGYLDIPVSGSVVPAEKGELLFLAGGDPAAIERMHVYLEVMGRKTLRFGPVGSGMKAKLIINLLLASHMEALAQVLLIGEGLDLDRNAVLDMILDSPLATPLYRIKRSNLEQRSYEKAFSVDLMTKDLSLLAGTLLRDGKSSSLPWQLHGHFREVQQSGRGNEDISSIYEYFRDRMMKR